MKINLESKAQKMAIGSKIHETLKDMHEFKLDEEEFEVNFNGKKYKIIVKRPNVITSNYRYAVDEDEMYWG